MSILIKGMEMPKNCGFCPFCRKTVTEWGSIYSADCIIRKMPIKFSELDLRDGLCPLIELPPHGRLIDADALIRVSEMIDGEWKTYIEEFEVDDAPTIIEAEGDTDG